MILSHDDIEDIAAATISDFNEFFYKGRHPESRTMPDLDAHRSVRVGLSESSRFLFASFF